MHKKLYTKKSEDAFHLIMNSCRKNIFVLLVEAYIKSFTECDIFYQ